MSKLILTLYTFSITGLVAGLFLTQPIFYGRINSCNTYTQLVFHAINKAISISSMQYNILVRNKTNYSLLSIIIYKKTI